MKVKLEKGTLCISLCDLLDTLTPEEKRSVADGLACQEEIIADVVAQIIDGSTPLGSWGYEDVPAQPTAGTALCRARRQIAVAANDVAKNEIRRLEDSLRLERAECAKFRTWGYKLYHLALDAGLRVDLTAL